MGDFGMADAGGILFAKLKPLGVTCLSFYPDMMIARGYFLMLWFGKHQSVELYLRCSGSGTDLLWSIQHHTVRVDPCPDLVELVENGVRFLINNCTVKTS